MRAIGLEYFGAELLVRSLVFGIQHFPCSPDFQCILGGSQVDN